MKQQIRWKYHGKNCHIVGLHVRHYYVFNPWCRTCNSLETFVDFSSTYPMYACIHILISTVTLYYIHTTHTHTPPRLFWIIILKMMSDKTLIHHVRIGRAFSACKIFQMSYDISYHDECHHEISTKSQTEILQNTIYRINTIVMIMIIIIKLNQR